MNKTSIEWVKNPDGSQGYTWNPITGCLNHTPEGLCLGGLFPCYAYKLAKGRLRQRYLANDNTIKTRIFPEGELVRSELDRALIDPFYPRFWQSRLLDGRDELCSTKPKGIFVCDMGELFGDWIPQEWQDKIFNVIKSRSQHRFYLLTKQPQNLPQWFPFPENCWVGVSVTNEELWDKAILYLHNIKATKKYLSFEPCLFVPRDIEWVLKYQGQGEGRIADWVIIGTQTKPYKPPEISWVEEIVRACDKAGVRVFLKDNLKPLVVNRWGKDNMYNILDHAKTLKTKVLELRQEMPG